MDKETLMCYIDDFLCDGNTLDDLDDVIKEITDRYMYGF